MSGPNSLSNGGVGGAGASGDSVARSAESELSLWNSALTPADAAAMDAIVDAGWDLAAVGGEHRRRAEHIMALLDLAGRGPAEVRDEALEDVVLLRVARLRASGVPAEAAIPTEELCEQDAAALDAIMQSGLSVEGLRDEQARRGRRQVTLLSLLNVEPLEGREERIERTLAAVQRAIEAEEDRMVLPEVAPRGRRLHFADLVSIAALLLIGSAVLLPIVQGVREYGRRTACQSGMLAAGLGFGQYAASNQDMLPMASTSRGGNPWWEVGGSHERSNSANFFTLVRTGYTSVAELACPGNPDACRSEADAGEMDWRHFRDVSYSYRNLFGRGSARLVDGPAEVLISDRSTLVLLRPGYLQVRPFENSPNHGGRGQWVLVGDGSARWITSPVLNDGDNLWLPRSMEDALARLRGDAPPSDLNGTETPDGNGDEFVAP